MSSDALKNKPTIQTLDLEKVTRITRHNLDKLVTNDGILASTSAGWKGLYNHMFGRDSAIVALLVFDAEEITKDYLYCDIAYQALLKLGSFQATSDDARSGRQAGKIPHEILSNSGDTSEPPRVDMGLDIWHLDERSGHMINWDSVDSTPLWILAVHRYHQLRSTPFSPETREQLFNALQWCLRNMSEFDGLAGFIPAKFQPHRNGPGLHNQGWKDSDLAYGDDDDHPVAYPVKDVFVNSLFWAALRSGAELFSESDPAFSAELRQQAASLKTRFNSAENGFLIKDKTQETYYFAEAIDANGNKLAAVAADSAMCLWPNYHGETVIAEEYLSDVVTRILQPDVFNERAGIRSYSLDHAFMTRDNGYHRSSWTYWPFVSAVISSALVRHGYPRAGKHIAEAMLIGVNHFESAIELFVETEDGEFEPWRHAELEQESAENQAWTAAAMYFALTLLKSD